MPRIASYRLTTVRKGRGGVSLAKSRTGVRLAKGRGGVSLAKSRTGVRLA